MFETIHCTFYTSQIRYIVTHNILYKVVPKNIKGKGTSSNEWVTRQLNDIYVKKSRYDRYRCRSAYKLMEIDEKYKILKPGLAVVDCGAAPGSWTQVVLKKLELDQSSEGKESNKGIVISVDLQYINPLKGATLLREKDFTDPAVQEEISHLLPDGKADVILSDMAPKATGIAELDNTGIMTLVYSTLQFSMKTLKKGGVFLCKVWEHNEIDQFVKNLQKIFENVRRVKPSASRSDSSEIYILAKGYKNNFCTPK